MTQTFTPLNYEPAATTTEIKNKSLQIDRVDFDEPSARVLANILNYSKNLEVKDTSLSNFPIEYLKS